MTEIKKIISKISTLLGKAVHVLKAPGARLKECACHRKFQPALVDGEMTTQCAVCRLNSQLRPVSEDRP